MVKKGRFTYTWADGISAKGVYVSGRAPGEHRPKVGAQTCDVHNFVIAGHANIGTFTCVLCGEHDNLINRGAGQCQQCACFACVDCARTDMISSPDKPIERPMPLRYRMKHDTDLSEDEWAEAWKLTAEASVEIAAAEAEIDASTCRALGSSLICWDSKMAARLAVSVQRCTAGYCIYAGREHMPTLPEPDPSWVSTAKKAVFDATAGRASEFSVFMPPPAWVHDVFNQIRARRAACVDSTERVEDVDSELIDRAVPGRPKADQPAVLSETESSFDDVKTECDAHIE